MLTQADFRQARKRLLRMHYESGVGHIGGNLSALDAVLLIFHEYLKPTDTFILSKGHAAGALYIAMWSKQQLSDEDLQTFHADGTLLAGHPPASGIPEIPFATGSLGHGLSLAAGTALGLRLTSREGHVFCFMSDGEWQEGSTWEALIFATHHQLKNLTILVDHNELQGFGSTQSVASMAPLRTKLTGFDIAVETVDGHDPAAMRIALERPTDRPRILILNTIKGRGISFMENRMEWHYLPLEPEQFHQATMELEH